MPSEATITSEASNKTDGNVAYGFAQALEGREAEMKIIIENLKN